MRLARSIQVLGPLALLLGGCATAATVPTSSVEDTPWAVEVWLPARASAPDRELPPASRGLGGAGEGLQVGVERYSSPSAGGATRRSSWSARPAPQRPSWRGLAPSRRPDPVWLRPRSAVDPLPLFESPWIGRMISDGPLDRPQRGAAGVLGNEDGPAFIGGLRLDF